MKRILLLIIAINIGMILMAQSDNFYYANGVAQYWEDDVTSANIIVGNSDHYDAIVYGLDSIFNSIDDEIIADNEDINIIINSLSLAAKDKYDIIANVSISSNDIAFFSYSKIVNGNHIWLTNEVYVKLKDSLYYSTHILPSLSQYQDINVFYEGDNEYRIVCCTENQVVAIANQLYDTNYVVYSTPDFYSEIDLCTNDEYYDEQWNLKNTGDDGGIAGVDIKAEEAWCFLNKTIGELGSNIKVAVIDDGVEEHEDFYLDGDINKFLEGYTANGYGTGRPIKTGWHGQMVAGIIAATHNNIGIAGIAPNARIVPFRIFKKVDKYGRDRIFSNAKVANAIRKSWDDYGCLILNNSWGGSLPNDKKTYAIEYVAKNGRNGKGCFVAFASGNQSGAVTYPANLDCVMAVGAINDDGEKNIFSNYGNKLDVVAPTNVPTIDRMGDYGKCGNRISNPNYYSSFSGTSAACPHVSGIVALMLSVNPNLTRLELTDIIRRTAQKVGGYDYQIQNNDPQMTWCPETGYGLIDAHMAVVESMLYGTNPTLNGPNEMNFCDNYIYTCDIVNPDAFSYEWTHSSNLSVISSNNNTINVKPIASSGQAWIKVSVHSEDRLIRTFEINNININDSFVESLAPLSPSTVHFTQNTTLNNDNHYLVLDAIVEENVTLTITGTVFCSDLASIKVKPGGRLVIDGGVLTSACQESKWQGIQVWGIDSLHQHLSNGKYLQGVLELKNGATIENAVCAVDLWNPLDEHSEGGIVWAENATFRNNAKAIRALNYSNYTPNSGLESQNASWFRNCSFIIDSDYIGNNTFYNHVELNNVDGIKFYACSFSADNSASQLASSISAIYASSAGFTVTSECSSPGFPCPEDNLIYSNFNGFDNAIHVTNNGGSVRTFSVSGSEFWNNERGIYATNTGYATIINNKFYIGSKTLNNYGIYIENVMNFCIEENYFTATKKANSYGLVVVNSPSYNEIYLNHFYNLHYGNIAGGVNVSATDSNIGLAYICNTNEGNTNDFGVMQYNRQAYIKLYQGSSTIAAANTFSATNYHFYNEGNFLIKYFYNGGANRPTRVLRVSSVAAAKNHECESHYDVVVGGGGGSGGGMMSAEKTDSLKNKYENSFSSFNRLNSLNTYKIEKDSAQRIQQESQMSMLQRECLLTAGDIVRSNLNKEERDFNELREWLGKSNDISSARMIIASYIQQKDFVNAIALAKTLPAAYDLQGEELNEFYDYLEIIRLHESLNETNRSTLQLSDYETALLEDIAENGTGASKAMAEAILAENRGLPTIVISACPTIPNFATAVRGTDESEMTSDTAFKVELSPNPASTKVEVSYTLPEGLTSATLVMTNTLGVNVMTVHLDGNNGKTTLSLEELPSGIYFYTIRCGENVKTGKLVKR